jgi:putative hemolysin
VPSVGDHFRWGDLRFEIVDMDRKRIDKVLVSAPGKARDQKEDESAKARKDNS